MCVLVYVRTHTQITWIFDVSPGRGFVLYISLVLVLEWWVCVCCVMGTGWAPASSVGTSYIYPHKAVLNFSLHEGGNVVMPNNVLAATLGYAMPEGSSQGLKTYFPTYPGDVLSRLGNIRSSTPGTVRLSPLGAQESQTET